MSSARADDLPTVSVVTISFNQVQYLRECLESVLRQDYPRLDYVVVDPGSTDGSRELLEEYRSRLSHLVLEPDKGPADGLNKGFALAKGEILAYLNSDDRLLPGALEFAARYFALHKDVDVMSGAIRLVAGDGKPKLRGMTSDLFDPVRFVSGICLIGQQATFFRRSTFERVGGFNAANRINWDTELWVDMWLDGATFAVVDKPLADFRLYATNITGSGKYLERINQEHDRLNEKIRAHGLGQGGEHEIKLRRACYKLNPLRHLRYFMVNRARVPSGWPLA